MKLFYITLNSNDEAKAISQALLEQQVAVCTNWFPISCAYRWEGKINVGDEIAMIVKTQEGKREAIERILAEHISYTNFVGELDVHSINEKFANWLDTEVN